MFGLNVLLDRLCEWLTLLPTATHFPQTEHLAMLTPPCTYECSFELPIFIDSFIDLSLTHNHSAITLLRWMDFTDSQHDYSIRRGTQIQV